jgi:hypothetical protein
MFLDLSGPQVSLLENEDNATISAELAFYQA